MAVGLQEIRDICQRGMTDRRDSFPGQITEREDCVQVKGEEFRVDFKNGLLSGYYLGDCTVIEAPVKPNFFRATTDNDGIWDVDWKAEHVKEWKNALLEEFNFYMTAQRVRTEQDVVVVEVVGKALPTSHYIGYDMKFVYRILSDGAVLVEMHGTPYGSMPARLPRIGVKICLGKGYEEAVWYGRGPRQNYCDSRLAAPVGLYSASIESLNTLFDVPQECGNHEDTRFLCLKGNKQPGMCVIGCDRFAFSCHNFTQRNLEKARHRNELRRTNGNLRTW